MTDGLVRILIIGALFFGWGSNFKKLTDCDFESPYKCEVIRGIGISPIGSVTGYMDFDFDGK